MITFKPYEKVSTIYKGLMYNLDYLSWSKYILLIADGSINHKSKILELGSGKCEMAGLIADRYKNYIASDISFQMLRSSEKLELIKVCCDMTSLPFNSKFDFIFSAFDSVNYILKKKLLRKLFEEVNHLLQDGGLFTFDVSLEENSLNFIISKITEGRFNGYSYRMISKYNKRSRIHSNKFYIWNDSDEKYNEVHKEKIYNIETYFELAEKAGLYTVACYDCFGFDDINEKTKRAQFVMRKMN